MGRWSALVLFLLIGWFSQKATDGFSLYKIQSNLTFDPRWEVDSSFSREFVQPYSYLGSGAQSFAFVSADGRYVLKFFRHHRASHPLQKVSFLFPEKWKARLSATVEKRLAKREKDFSSYALAHKALQEESGLLYLHLNKTSSLHTTLPLFDKIGVRHKIDLDKMEFLIQKKADPLYPQLKSWIDDKDFDRAKEALASVVQILERRGKKEISDKNPDLRTNFGLIGTRAVQFDIGRFRLEECSEKARRDEVVRICDRLATWLDAEEPSLAQYLRERARG